MHDAADRSELLKLLRESLNDLAAAGQVERASQLAGKACALLRRTDPKGWQQFNALLHRLSRMPDSGVLFAWPQSERHDH